MVSLLAMMMNQILLFISQLLFVEIVITTPPPKATRYNDFNLFRNAKNCFKVEFDVIQGFKGPEAWSVTGLDGKPIQGVRLLTNYNRSFNNARNGSKTFRPSNGRRRRNTNVPRDDVLESDHNGDAETKNLKIETEIEVNAKGDSSNEKRKFFLINLFFIFYLFKQSTAKIVQTSLQNALESQKPLLAVFLSRFLFVPSR